MVDVRSRIFGKLLFAALATAAVGAASACSAPEDPAPPKVGVTRSRLTVHPTTKRIRVAHWNTFARPSTGSVMAGSEGSAETLEEHAASVAATVKRHKSEFDVIAFNEVFTDQARKAIFDELHEEFPHWVRELDGPLNVLSQSNVSDSGLALYSRYPFADLLPVPDDNYYVADTSAPGFLSPCPPDRRNYPDPPADGLCTFHPNVAFKYTENVDTDAKAAKGWGLVRIDGPWKPLNLAFTHLQADYPENTPPAAYPDVRQRQLFVARDVLARRLGQSPDGDTIITGDLNIDGLASNFSEPGSPATAAVPSRKMAASEYGKSIWSNVADLPFYDAWRTTSPEDDGQTHRFFGPPARYDYFLVNGAGYYDSVTPWNPLAPTFVANGAHGFTCPQYVRRIFQDGNSDHVGLILDLGPWSLACRPDMAIRPENDQGWPVTKSVYRTDVLPQPGAVMWYRFDGPGSYTVGFPVGSDAAARLRIEAYPVNDLSYVIPSIDSGSVTRVPGIEGDFETTTFFSGTQPFYLRVYDPEGRSSGSFNLMVKKHDCSSIEWACPLKPAVEMQPEIPLGQPYVGHFRVNTLSTGSALPQTISFEIRNPSQRDLRVTVSNVTAGVSFTETFREAVWRKEFKSRDAELYRVMVERSDNSQVYSVTYRTDLTLFTGFPDYGASISLLEETAGWGNDEIRAVLEDDRGDAFAQWFWPEMDANEGMPLFVTMPFVRSAQLYVAELADEEGAAVNYFSVDESARVPISPLSSEKENQLGIVKTFSLCELPPNQADCQGKLQLRYNLVHSLDP